MRHCAETRSWPNGFSTMIRAPAAHVDFAAALDALARASAKPIEVPSGLRNTHDGHVQMSSLHHCVQGRKDLLVREIARRTKEDERVGVGSGHTHTNLKRHRSYRSTRCVNHYDDSMGDARRDH